MESQRFELETTGRRAWDITDQVRRFASEAGGDGLLHVFLPHATAGLAVIETGAGSEADLEDTIERLLPRDERYQHSHGSRGHGADHVLPAFIAPTLTLVVDSGQLDLGTWQSVVVVDTNEDNPRRTVRLTFLPG